MKKVFSLLTLTLLTVAGFANNITVNNATTSGQNTTTHAVFVNFDVAWENSWRTSTNESNYDGAWIFVKFRKNGTTDWRHATISTTGNTAATGAAFSVPTDSKGAFIYRAADGLGNVNYLANQLKWNYGVDGLLDNETVEIRVFALEMVYIPAGGFQLGSGGSETNPFKTGATALPYDVTGASITFGTTGASLNANGVGPASGSIPAAFPTGNTAFWLMKYETSQQQYADFLNHLDLARATFNNTPAIFTGVHPNLVAPQPERAIGNVSTQRLAAMADWSGLRPFTELEYEKACRGFNTPALPNEYAWGNTTAVLLTGVTTAGGAAEAVATPLTANANFNSTYSTLSRVGLFARPSASSRQLSGATYYGVMNMSDNVYEICVAVQTPAGLAFDGSLHGDGNLAATGDANQTNWTSYTSYGLRGSAATGNTTSGRTSDRQMVTSYNSIYGYDVVLAMAGIRLARTAQ